MITENAERLRARISELENDLMNKSNGGDIANNLKRNNEVSDDADETSEERAEVMQSLLKELRSELISKEEVLILCIVRFSFGF